MQLCGIQCVICKPFRDLLTRADCREKEALAKRSHVGTRGPGLPRTCIIFKTYRNMEVTQLYLNRRQVSQSDHTHNQLHIA